MYLGDRTIRNEGTLVDAGDSGYGHVVDLQGAVVLDSAAGSQMKFTGAAGWGWNDWGGRSTDSLTLNGAANVTQGNLYAYNTNVTLQAGATIATGGLHVQGSLVAQGDLDVGWLSLTSGTYTVSGSTRVAGDFSLASGTLTAGTGDVTVQGRFSQSGGTLDGTGVLTLSGASNTWTGGEMTGGGTTKIAEGATLTIGGTNGGRVYLGDRTIRNEGKLVDAGDSRFGFVLELEGAAILVNVGTFDVRTNGGWLQTGGVSGALTVTNFGFLTKTGGAGDFNFGNVLSFTNEGDIFVPAGAGRLLVNGSPLSSLLLPRPNLVVQGVVVAGPGGAGTEVFSGDTLRVSWSTFNTSTVAAGVPFMERVEVLNAGGAVLASVALPYDPFVSGPIAADGGAVARFADIALPEGPAGAGTLTVRVTTDVFGAIFEQGPGGEFDNTTPQGFNSTLRTYADLVPQGLAVSLSSGLAAGDTVTVDWQVRNAGDRAVQGGWVDEVRLVNEDTGAVVTVAVGNSVRPDRDATRSTLAGPCRPPASARRRRGLGCSDAGRCAPRPTRGTRRGRCGAVGRCG